VGEILSGGGESFPQRRERGWRQACQSPPKVRENGKSCWSGARHGDGAPYTMVVREGCQVAPRRRRAEAEGGRKEKGSAGARYTRHRGTGGGTAVGGRGRRWPPHRSATPGGDPRLGRWGPYGAAIPGTGVYPTIAAWVQPDEAVGRGQPRLGFLTAGAYRKESVDTRYSTIVCTCTAEQHLPPITGRIHKKKTGRGGSKDH